MFITNKEGTSSLGERITELIGYSKELKFLVGFFYFSGLRELYEALKKNKEVTLKVLVGLEVRRTLSEIITEVSINQLKYSRQEVFGNYLRSLKEALNAPEMDTAEFCEQVAFFIELIKENRLIIRKTLEPNHAKLYLFKMKKEYESLTENLFITGSSNLTYAGLKRQNEFNVEIKGFGFEEAEKYFDGLWEKSEKITEREEYKPELLELLTTRTLASRVSPYEAYVFMLKSYLELFEDLGDFNYLEKVLREAGFKSLSYQVDAVKQALSIIETYGGVIIADVVGLGKSVIASLIAKALGKRGLILCPPSLIGNKDAGTGWYEYINKFQLYDWDIESIGKLEQISDRDYEVIIVDEAHRFRNQDTISYENLYKLCVGKKVILLTATPFNNTPADIFSLLKLFIVPGASPLTIDTELETRFNYYHRLFRELLQIQKDPLKNEKYYRRIFKKSPPSDSKKVQAVVNEKIREMSREIKNLLAPVVIRRNRLDLKNDVKYRKEINTFSEVKDPEELFFELTPEQSAFYDKVINNYFGEKEQFSGAIYRPSDYEKNSLQEENQTPTQQQQRNLFHFMRRLLVKRFESSFGAFRQTIERFIEIHEKVLEFIETTGLYVLDRKLIETAILEDNEETSLLERIEKLLQEFQEKAKKATLPKHTIIYKLPEYKNTFPINIRTINLRKTFKQNIEKDLALLQEIKKEIEELNLVNEDPKREMVLQKVKEILQETPKRKVVLFTEYADTVKHLGNYFNKHLNNKVLVVAGQISRELYNQIEANFNAKSPAPEDDYDVLITTDKLSEGINLNRAGAIINYDIPWNPTRVIQRVGRINRIGTKLFDTLYIYNIFPTEQGKEHIKIREIAEHKMFLIHNVLGEDAKIFNPGEIPSRSELFKRINFNPEKQEEISLLTKIRNELESIKERNPELISKVKRFPNRIKTAKKFSKNNVLLFRRKGLALFALEAVFVGNEIKVQEKNIEEVIETAKCEPQEQALEISREFWKAYEALQKHTPTYKNKKNIKGSQSFEVKALNSLKTLLRQKTLDNELIAFIRVLIEDLQKYHTLPTSILRKLILKEGNHKEVLRYIRELKNQIGADYLEKLEKRTKKVKDEVIVSIENQA